MRTPTRRTIHGLGVDHYEAGAETGSDAGVDVPTVVVVHGAMDRAAGFRRVIRHLESFEVIAYDRRGYATSVGATISSAISDHVDDLCSICDSAGRPVVVVGHSQGALLALHAAARRAAGIVGLVAWEPPMPWFEWYGGSVGASALGTNADVAAERFMRAMIGDHLWDRLPEPQRLERVAEGPALLADLAASRSPDSAPELASIGVPTVAGSGSESRDHHRRSAAVVAAQVHGATLVEVEGAGHGVHLSHPAAFAEIISKAAVSAGSR